MTLQFPQGQSVFDSEDEPQAQTRREQSRRLKRVIVFGTFDPLHEGHRALLRYAAALGDELLVIAARDSYIRLVKGREPRTTAAERQRALKSEPTVAAVRWGDEWPSEEPYRLLRDLSFDVLVVGHDQEPTNAVIAERLRVAGKEHVQVVRLPKFPAPDKPSL